MEVFKNKYRIISDTFMRMANKIHEIEKIPRRFGTDINIFHSEIHTIEAIGKNSEVKITELSKYMGVTKGAISQTINKLENKELVEKYKKPDNYKEVYLRLTPKGEIAFHNHELIHLEMQKDFFEDFEKINPEFIDFLILFLKNIEDKLSKY